ncbi:glycerophosphoryl diester phosphodiesterase [Pedobacter psychrotolerans]|uniref:Glycerophosphoryl diester phosphodiesterase n=1 Tax=Pedobacter psychrotolerans TaxID=1843235 RepID=A0A4R2HJD0_9SPHI|nr:glycerophosphodiester phosphodiesterase family protein [Pedobacter psychrotolerans]TCO27123.1 glycerophosphoryl diester phosphodiesterase [Pedobacter psychrotolerans]GGE59093.1 glycerophosphoryl diester phosphodiesterase [Pedobacter psychrotolerans]
MGLKKNLALCIILLSSFCLPVFSQQVAKPLPTSKHGFIVIAHRGSHLTKPENTIAAIEEAIALGADYVELDLRTTRDGQLVLLHNDRVDQVSNGKGLIKDLDFEEVKKLTLKGTDGSMHQVASFADALKTCKGRINIYLDFKAADVNQAYKAIEKAGMADQVLVYINELQQYYSWKKVAPNMPLMSSLDKAIGTKEELLKALDKMPLDAVDNIPSENLLPVIRSLGMSVFLDVQKRNETPDDWMNAMKKGIQGMQTDHPEELIKYLKLNKLRDGLKIPSGK